MADFSNRQLAEIITKTGEKISTNVLKERKIANELETTKVDLSKSIEEFKTHIANLSATSIKPDLSDLNKFYEENTAENIKRINSRLNVPNLIVYVWITSVVLFIISALMIWFFLKSKQEIINEYESDLKKGNKVIVPKENDILFKDMYNWFEKNPKTRDSFIQWRTKNK